MQISGAEHRKFLTELFNAYAGNPGLLDDASRLRAQQDGLKRVVCDIVAGMTDGALGRDPKVDPMTYGPQIDAMMQGRMAAIKERQQVAGAAFLAEASKETGATTDAAGMVYLQLEAGEGAQPGPNDGVMVRPSLLHRRAMKSDRKTAVERAQTPAGACREVE